MPAPPPDLDELERKTWERLAEAVSSVGVYTSADLVAFGLLVAAVAQFERGRRGASPGQFVQLVRGAIVQLERWSLTPTSRSRLVPLATPAEQQPERDPDAFAPLSLVPVPQ